jgi:hypothetical protein
MVPAAGIYVERSKRTHPAPRGSREFVFLALRPWAKTIATRNLHVSTKIFRHAKQNQIAEIGCEATCFCHQKAAKQARTLLPGVAFVHALKNVAAFERGCTREAE